MKTLFHVASSRGHADHGWLKTHHSFSFSSYNNPERMNFGALRVLNDDRIRGGTGFGKHPHRDMEIITIPLSGSLRHSDDMSNKGVISKGEVQVMSAGTGIVHSEMNADSKEDASFLQIWIFPNTRSAKPRYGQFDYSKNAKQNCFQQIVSPDPDDTGAWIHQNAWIYIGNFDARQIATYHMRKNGNGAYLFVIDGKIKIGDQLLNKRDSLGIWDTTAFDIEIVESTEILLIEVPMELPQ